MKKKEEEKVIEPKYAFGEYADMELIPGEPLKKKVTKTMEITETFTIFDVMQYIAKLKKGIEDKDAEKQGLVNMLEAYEKELALIEKNLGVMDLQKKWEKEQAETLSAEEIVKEIINEYEEENN
jgi:hypothetical protein